MSKYPGIRKNTSLGVLGDWHFFPCAVFLQTMNFVVCGFHPFIDVVTIVHCFVEAQSVGIAIKLGNVAVSFVSEAKWS